MHRQQQASFIDVHSRPCALSNKTLRHKVTGILQIKHKRGEESTEQEEEEHTVSVISNLFQGLSRGSRRDRVAAKFVENEFEKCDRLMELYNRYLTKVVAEQVKT